MPFVILVDGREQKPYRFDQIRGDAKQRKRPLDVSVEWAHLKTGDYSIRGYDTRVAVERKSLEDLYNTLGQNRDRFEREHERLAEFETKLVVIEAEWSTILRRPPDFSRLNPKTIIRTCLSWQTKYGVPWIALPGRRAGELACFRILYQFWRNQLSKGSENE